MAQPMTAASPEITTFSRSDAGLESSPLCCNTLQTAVSENRHFNPMHSIRQGSPKARTCTSNADSDVSQFSPSSLRRPPAMEPRGSAARPHQTGHLKAKIARGPNISFAMGAGTEL